MGFECPECGVDKGSRLYYHLFDAHSYTKDAIAELKKSRRQDRVLTTCVNSKVHTCCVCGLQYAKRGSLYKHLRMKHKDVFPNVAAKGLKCPMCAKEVQIHRNLVEHVVLAHSGNPDEYKVEKVVFHDRNSFEEWRLKTEKKYGIRWVIASSKSFVSRKVKRFRCDKALPTPKYVAKRPRSKKIVSCCTAFMEVIERGNTLEVQYCRTHCGHGTLFDVMNTCHEADPAPLLPLEPDVDISVETDINLLQSNWDLLDHFDADVAALRSKLILLSKLPQRDVNEHLSRIRETIKYADNSTSVMCSSYGIPDCPPASRTAMVPPEPVNSGASSTREE